MTSRNEMISQAIKTRYGQMKRDEAKAAARARHIANFYGRRKGAQARARKQAEIIAGKILAR